MVVTTPAEVQAVLTRLKAEPHWPTPELVREARDITFYRYRHNDKTFSVFTTDAEVEDSGRSGLHVAREKIRHLMMDFYTNHPCVRV